MINFLFEQISDLLLPLHMKYLISEANGSNFSSYHIAHLFRKPLQPASNAESITKELVVAFDIGAGGKQISTWLCRQVQSQSPEYRPEVKSVHF